MDFCRGASVEGRVWSSVVVELHVGSNVYLGIAVIRVFAPVYLLVFEASPEAFHECVIQCSTFTVHGDLDSVLFEQPYPVLTSEL